MQAQSETAYYQRNEKFRKEEKRTKGGTKMAIDVNAYLKGNVPFQSISDFIRETEGKDVKAELNESENPNDSFAWLRFRDKEGEERTAFCIFVEENEGEFPSELSGDKEGGFTIISLHSDEEGRRILRSVTERFGGYFQPFDNKTEFERLPKP